MCLEMMRHVLITYNTIHNKILIRQHHNHCELAFYAEQATDLLVYFE